MLKHPYLEILYGKEGMAEMAQVKTALDPKGILGRGNIFPESLIRELPASPSKK
jgi:FAD/FMN-containing dehydrogenase